MPLFRKRRRDKPEPEPRREPGERPGRSPAPPPSKPAKEPPFDWRSYDAIADDYARIYGPHTAKISGDLLDLAGVAATERILDVGTGTGHALDVAEAKASEGLVVGIDSAWRMLKHAHGARVAAAEVINLPFEDEQFDVAMLAFSLPYFTKLDTSLFDVRRVLKPGGRLVASVWGADEDELSRTWRTMVEESIGRDILKAGLRDEAPWAEKLSDPKRFDTALRDAGFRPVNVERRRYRFAMSREDYIRGHEIEASGRYARAMLGERLWEGFRGRVRTAFEERFPEQLVDFRDVLLAHAVKPVR